jgi:hypothetical protein
MLKTPKEVFRAAKDLIRSKLRERGEAPANEDLRSVPLSSQNQKALTLPQELADVIGVEIECLRLDDKFGDILSVHSRDLSEDIQRLMKQIGLTDSIDPFGLDLLHFIEKRGGGDESRLRRPAFLPLPSDESEWIERIMEMTVRQFLIALA